MEHALPIDENSDFLELRQRLKQLELWREIAVRPSLEDCHPMDRDLLNREIDDVAEISRRSLAVRSAMNDRLPTSSIVDPKGEDLYPEPSTIPGSGLGLFYRPTRHPTTPPPTITQNEVICYYYGHIHNFHSAKQIRDKSYLMTVSGDILVDPGPLPQIKARYINDPLDDSFINCEFVPEKNNDRSAVVSTRVIRTGEELFVSYGEGYWAGSDIVGKPKSARPENDEIPVESAF